MNVEPGAASSPENQLPDGATHAAAARPDADVEQKERDSSPARAPSLAAVIFAAVACAILGSATLGVGEHALTNILLYHVVEGKVMAADVVGLSEAPTLQGSSAAITVEDGSVFVDNAQVIITDIEASNGVIHVIDAVIIPAE